MLRELEGTFAGLSPLIDDPEENGSDEEEAFHDVAEPKEDGIPLTSTTALTTNLPRHDRNAPSHYRYKPRKREPLHSNAAASTLWDLLPFLKHYHPSVSLFAARLLTHDAMPPKTDLSSHTLIHFLDRFVYRNPKSTTAARGASIMQPISSFTGRSDARLSAASDDNNDDDIPDLADDGEDDEALLGNDDEVPSDLEAIFEKEALLDNREGGKAPLRGEGGKKEKRRKLKHLPTFADADEYAKDVGRRARGRG
ncbi:MAG: hypothetical protein L6R37_008421 [Teloschistes peruensis]|nr:MAG: hypothetical protein L6R37_008421 [Teloschistes peruensis]